MLFIIILVNAYTMRYVLVEKFIFRHIHDILNTGKTIRMNKIKYMK